MIEIELTRAGLWRVGALLLVGAWALVGWRASPRAEDGRPVLLLPAVRAVEAYRREAVRWSAEWQALEHDLGALLAAPETDLLSLGRNAERHFERAVSLAADVDSTAAPPAMLGLEEQAARVAAAYVDAAVAVARWVSAPTDANRAAAEQTVASAGGALAELRGNAWVAARGP